MGHALGRTMMPQQLVQVVLAKIIVVELEKGFYGVNVVSNTGIDPTAANFRTYAATVKSEAADCFFFAGITSNGATQIAGSKPFLRTFS